MKRVAEFVLGLLGGVFGFGSAMVTGVVGAVELQGLEEAERQFQEDRLRQAAGDFRPLLSRLSVDLAALLGEDRAMPDLA